VSERVLKFRLQSVSILIHFIVITMTFITMMFIFTMTFITMTFIYTIFMSTTRSWLGVMIVGAALLLQVYWKQQEQKNLKKAAAGAPAK
jgi:energy-coupling factor transporter transmembrane protein EcfT